MLLLSNTHITTLDDDNPTACAMVVSDDIIQYLGDLKTARERFPSSKLVDLDGQHIVPGFIDAHGHLLLYGYTLIDAQTPVNTQSGWIRGRGWKDDTPHPLQLLDTDNPICLTRIDEHALWCNQTAMRIAGINNDTPDPPGGRIVRGAKGQATGVFIDNAMELIRKHLPPRSREEQIQAAIAGANAICQLGITSFHDAWSTADDVAIYKYLCQERKMPVRLNLMIDGRDKSLVQQHLSQGPEVNSHLRIGTIKLFADGALGSRGACLFEPYTDNPHNSGLELLSEDEIFETTVAALQNGFQVATHAIGDKTNHIVLNAYERALKLTGTQDARLRIEHAQIVAPEDIKRFAQLGIIASVQPSHYTSDKPWACSRLGEKRMAKSGYPWRALLDAGVRVAFGSDAPVEDPDPRHTLDAAGDRYAQALRCYTQEGAYAEFAEHKKGKLKAGYLADFTF